MDKLLWQIELVPPSQSNVKSVAQAIDGIEKAQGRSAQATEKNRQAVARSKEEYDDYAKQIDDYRLTAKRAENQSRFNNEEMEKSVRVIENQKEELQGLRAQILRNMKDSKKRTRLLTRIETSQKSLNLSQQRLKNGWQGMSTAMSKGNNTLIATGRILQDLPYGFIGISNNIEELAFNFRNLADSTDQATGKQLGFKGAVGAMMKSFKGSGGLLFLLGSALPFALTVASSGMPGFKNLLGDTGDEAETSGEKLDKFQERVKSIALDQFSADTAVSELFLLQGALDSLSQDLASGFEIETDSFEAFTFEANQYVAESRRATEQVDLLGRSLQEVQAEQKNITEEVEIQLSKRVNQLRAEQRIKQEVIALKDELSVLGGEARTTLQEFNLGIMRVSNGSSQTVASLREMESTLEDSYNELVSLYEQGDEDVMPQLQVTKNRLDKVRDALGELDEDVKTMEQEEVEPLAGLTTSLTKFEAGVSGSREELLSSRVALQTYVKTWRSAVESGNNNVLPYLTNAIDLLNEMDEALFVGMDDLPDMSGIMDITMGNVDPSSISNQISEFMGSMDLSQADVDAFNLEMDYNAKLANAEGFEAKKLKIQKQYAQKRRKLIDSGLQYFVDMKKLEEAKNAEIEQAKHKHTKQMQMQTFKAVTTSAGQLFGALSELNQAQSDETEAQARKRFETQKKLSTASAIVSSLEAFTVALADGEIPPLARAIRAGSILATGFAKVKAIQSQEFNSGGTSSGASGTGGLDTGFNERDLPSGTLSGVGGRTSENTTRQARKSVANTSSRSEDPNFYIQLKNDITSDKLEGYVRKGRNSKLKHAIKVRSD